MKIETVHVCDQVVSIQNEILFQMIYQITELNYNYARDFVQYRREGSSEIMLGHQWFLANKSRDDGAKYL